MGKYDDIIKLPHHQSVNHPKMSNYNRAAQFAPFAALVGFSEAISNSEKISVNKIDLSDDRKEEIEETLRQIASKIKEMPHIKIKYFVRLNSSDNGKYVSFEGKLKRIDLEQKKIIFVNRKSISIKDIYDISIVQ